MKKLKNPLIYVYAVLTLSLSSFLYINFAVPSSYGQDSLGYYLSSGNVEGEEEGETFKSSEWIIATIINIAETVVLSKLSKAQF